jgi:hypothetical protein
VLMLAGTDRLDRTLTIGQMQGRFQMVLLPQVQPLALSYFYACNTQAVVQTLNRSFASACPTKTVVVQSLTLSFDSACTTKTVTPIREGYPSVGFA